MSHETQVTTLRLLQPFLICILPCSRFRISLRQFPSRFTPTTMRSHLFLAAAVLACALLCLSSWSGLEDGSISSVSFPSITSAHAIRKLTQKQLDDIEDQWMEDEVEEEGQSEGQETAREEAERERKGEKIE
jgi:hypothetical protein